MPRTLQGSCHCGSVKFTVETHTPVPYLLCFCSICRKTGGPLGSSDIRVIKDTLRVQGEEYVRIYRPVMDRDTPSERTATSEWSFCTKCASRLWIYFPERQPSTLSVFTTAIDAPLSAPPVLECEWISSKPDWVPLPEGEKHLSQEDDQSLPMEAWHRAHGLYAE